MAITASIIRIATAIRGRSRDYSHSLDEALLTLLTVLAIASEGKEIQELLRIAGAVVIAISGAIAGISAAAGKRAARVRGAATATPH